jgi:hypothetical protein
MVGIKVGKKKKKKKTFTNYRQVLWPRTNEKTGVLYQVGT